MIYRFADFELDDALFELRRDGVRLPVQPKVLALLLHLVRHGDRTVPKSELFAAVWPDEHVGETSLTRAVRGARQALGDDADPPVLLQSVRRIGYRFAAPVTIASAASESEAAARDPRRLPLVGRDAAIAGIEAHLAAAFAGRGRFVTLAGPPGIGKSRLLDEIAARARTLGAEVLMARCFEGDGAPPFWPWIQVLRAYARGRDASEMLSALGPGAADIVQAMPGLGDPLPDLPAAPQIDHAHSRFRLHDSVAAFLRRAAAPRPLAIFFDDLHEADLPSLRLLAFLARELADVPLLFAAARRDTVSVDPAREQVLSEPVRRDPATRIALEGLAPEAVARFVELASGAAPSAEAVAALHERTRGNPLFLSELIACGAVDAAALGPEVARGLEGAIERHLDVLSPRCCEMLRTAAVFGRDVALRPLAVACDLDGADLLGDLSACAQAGVIESLDATGARWRFTHGLIPEVIYAGLSAAERAARHRKVAVALADHYGEAEVAHLAELAHHFGQAAPLGDVDRAVGYAERASERAIAQMAYEEAALHSERALALLDLAEPQPARRVELLLRASSAWLFAGDYDRSRERDRQAVEVARATTSDLLFTRAVLGARAEEETGRVDPVRIALLEEVLERSGEGDGALRVRVLGRLASALYFADPEERHVALCREAVALARRLGDPHPLGYALAKLHFALLDPETLQERLGLRDELAAIANGTGNADLRVRSLQPRAMDALELGDRGALDVALEEQAALAQSLRHPWLAWQAKLWSTMRALLAGKITEADGLAHEALRYGRRIQQEIALEWYAVQIFQIRREQERLVELESALQRLVALYPKIGPWPISLALLEAEDGRGDTALRRVRELAGMALRRDLNKIVSLAVLAEAVWQLRDSESAAIVHAALAPYVGRCVMIGGAVAGYGSVDRYVGLLAHVLGRHDEAEQRFEAARRADRAMGAEGFVAHGALDLATLLCERGDEGDAARARELVAEGGAAAQRLGNPRLTRRARELDATLRGAVPLRRARSGGPTRAR